MFVKDAIATAGLLVLELNCTMASKQREVRSFIADITHQAASSHRGTCNPPRPSSQGRTHCRNETTELTKEPGAGAVQAERTSVTEPRVVLGDADNLYGVGKDCSSFVDLRKHVP